MGTTTHGQAVTWNLDAGVHDVEAVTERAVWRGGVPVPAGVMSMSDELDRVTTVDGGDLRFHIEAAAGGTTGCWVG